jgi:hypothetical protein
MTSVLINTKILCIRSSNPGHASWRGVIDTKLCDKICQLIAADGWFSLGTLVSSINENDSHDIPEMVIGTDCICSCKSNYHTIMTTAVP